jgi:hypothetical protein
MKERDALGDQKQDGSARYWMTLLRKKNELAGNGQGRQ